MFADADALLTGWLAAQFPNGRVLTELPADISTGTFIQVVRIGGSDDEFVDTARVDVDVYANPAGGKSGDEVARLLARQVQRALIYDLPGYMTAEGTVLRCNTVSGPSYRPYENSNVRRIGATYNVQIHARLRF